MIISSIGSYIAWGIVPLLSIAFTVAVVCLIIRAVKKSLDLKKEQNELLKELFQKVDKNFSSKPGNLQGENVT